MCLYLSLGLLPYGLAQSADGSLSNAEQSHQRALELNAAGDSTGAGIWFRKAWEQEPAQPDYVHDLTVYYIHRHEYTKGLQIIRDFVKRTGPTALAWTLQGELLFERGDYDPAFQSLRKAIEISTVNYRAHELIGLIFSINRRYALALDEMKIAVQQNPNSAQIRFYCGRLSYHTANYLASKDQFLACLKLQPNYPQARENLGLSYEALGDTASAAAQYNDAVELDRSGKISPSEFPYVCLGVLKGKQGSIEAARLLLEEGLARNPNSAWANFELGHLYFRSGGDEPAQRYLARAAELDKNFSRPHFFLAKIHQRGNRPNEAKAEFDRFQRLDKDVDNREPQVTR